LVHFESKELAFIEWNGYHFNNKTISVQIKKDSEEIESVLTKSIDVRWYSRVPIEFLLNSVIPKIQLPNMQLETLDVFSRFGLIESISSNRAEENNEDQDLLIFYKELFLEHIVVIILHQNLSIKISKEL
jgi:hypothetical protein